MASSQKKNKGKNSKTTTLSMETSDGETQVSTSTSDRQLKVPKTTFTSDQQVSTTTTMKPENKYTPQDKGPFVVLFKAETEIIVHYIAQNMKSQGLLLLPT